MRPPTPRAAALLELLRMIKDGLDRASMQTGLLTPLESATLNACSGLVHAVLSQIEERT